MLRTAGQVKTELATQVGMLLTRGRLKRADLDALIHAREQVERIPAADPAFEDLVRATDDWLKAIDPYIGDLVDKAIPDSVNEPCRQVFLGYALHLRTEPATPAADQVIADDPLTWKD